MWKCSSPILLLYLQGHKTTHFEASSNSWGPLKCWLPTKLFSQCRVIWKGAGVLFSTAIDWHASSIRALIATSNTAMVGWINDAISAHRLILFILNKPAPRRVWHYGYVAVKTNPSPVSKKYINPLTGNSLQVSWVQAPHTNHRSQIEHTAIISKVNKKIICSLIVV